MNGDDIDPPASFVDATSRMVERIYERECPRCGNAGTFDHVDGRDHCMTCGAEVPRRGAALVVAHAVVSLFVDAEIQREPELAGDLRALREHTREDLAKTKGGAR